MNLRLVARLVAVAVAGGLLAPSSALVAPASADHADPPGPVNAGTTNSWGRGDWMQHWEGNNPVTAAEIRAWRVRGRGEVTARFGMMTLRPSAGSLSATLTTHSWAEGRWEIRLRARRFSDIAGRRDYRVVTELVPAGVAYRCGTRNVAPEKHKIPGTRARVYARNVPDRQFGGVKPLDLSNNVWHTFGVELTGDKITWYIDAHPFVTEKRPESMHGLPLTVRFSMQAVRGRAMNPSWMQMDWIRYFDMNRGLSPEGPPATRSVFRNSCFDSATVSRAQSALESAEAAETPAGRETPSRSATRRPAEKRWMKAVPPAAPWLVRLLR